ncbi:MAG: OmpH family outer membrane protein [Flavobacteriaceae bacterium]|jgi:outer membrane protein|nr:OmpH family outer membrane protein [Flavobacteriaceae bacterium]
MKPIKKIIIYIFLMVFGLGNAQKIAYVDTQLILNQIAQYQEATQRLDGEIKRWQEEIENKQSALTQLRTAFENEKVLLTEAQQKTKQSAIDSLDKSIKKFIDKKFGTDGEATSLRYNLAKPIQDQIWNAINTVAVRESYGIIFDKSSSLVMVYTDPKYDITDKVLKLLKVGGDDDDNKKSSSQQQPSTRRTPPSEKTQLKRK